MFKDYEYGFYGYHASINAYWMNSGYCYNYIRNDNHKIRSHYNGRIIDLIKQIPKLKGVIFIYGDYKTCV